MNVRAKKLKNEKAFETLGIKEVFLYKLRDLISGQAVTKEPPHIPDFNLLETVKPFGSVGSYFMGIFSNTKEEKVFVKTWRGNHKDLNYLTLINEISFYKFFEKMSISQIKTPKIRAIHNKSSELSVVYEYIEGKKLEESSTELKLKTYWAVISFLDNISADKNLLINFPKRTYFSYLVTFLLILPLALINYPSKAAKLISSGILFTKLITIKNNFLPLSLCHRDLNMRNILISNNTSYLIDFQYTLLTLKEFEIASTIRSHIREKEFLEKMLAKVRNSNSFNTQILRQMLIYYAIMGLCDKRFRKERVEDFFDCLNLASNI
ncbi:MAG: phosphotransferase [Patescibacteria group bacterium]